MTGLHRLGASLALACTLATPVHGEMAPEIRDQLDAARLDARRTLERADATATDQATTQGNLARLLLAYGLEDEALAALDRAHALAPEQGAWLHLRGYVHASQGRLEAAEADFTRVVALAPEQTAAWVRLGRVRLDRDEIAGARSAFAEATGAGARRDGTNAAGHFGLGRTELRAGRWARAADHFEKALVAAPEATRIYTPLASALTRLGRREEAHAALQRRGPTPVPLPDPIVDGIGALASGAAAERFRGDQLVLDSRFAEAAQAYGAAARAAPEDFFIAKSLGLTLYRVGRTEDALRTLTRAATLDPGGSPEQNARERADVAFSIGGIHLNAGRTDQARTSFERVVALDPMRADGWGELGRVHGRAGRLDDALAAFTAGCKAAPGDVALHEWRATTLMDLDRFDEAVPALEALQQLAPSHPRVQDLLTISRDRAALKRRGETGR